MRLQPSELTLAERRRNRLFKMKAAGVGRNVLVRDTRVFAAVERANGIDGTGAVTVAVGLQEGADVGQFAAGPALNTAAPPPVGNRQHGRESPLDPGPPGVSLRIGHRTYPVESISIPSAVIRCQRFGVKRGPDSPSGKRVAFWWGGWHRQAQLGDGALAVHRTVAESFDRDAAIRPFQHSNMRIG